MSKSALLDIVPDSRRKTIYHEEDGKTYIESRQDCTHIVEAAKLLAEIAPSKEDGWRFLGLIPETVMNQAMIEGWFHDQRAWRAWLNNADNKAFNGGRDFVS